MTAITSPSLSLRQEAHKPPSPCSDLEAITSYLWNILLTKHYMNLLLMTTNREGTKMKFILAI